MTIEKMKTMIHVSVFSKHLILSEHVTRRERERERDRERERQRERELRAETCL